MLTKVYTNPKLSWWPVSKPWIEGDFSPWIRNGRANEEWGRPLTCPRTVPSPLAGLAGHVNRCSSSSSERSSKRRRSSRMSKGGGVPMWFGPKHHIAMQQVPLLLPAATSPSIRVLLYHLLYHWPCVAWDLMKHSWSKQFSSVIILGNLLEMILYHPWLPACWTDLFLLRLLTWKMDEHWWHRSSFW